MKLFALLLALVLLAVPATAAARERDVPRPGPLPAGAPLDRLDDTVLQHEARGMRAARAAAPNARYYATPDGYRVSVEASSSYTTDPAADQQLVDFLASRVHGAELGDLSVYVGTPPEIVQLCGGDPSVVACYAIDEQRMYVPGESVRGIPIEYPLTHEYGHHVAAVAVQRALGRAGLGRQVLVELGGRVQAGPAPRPVPRQPGRRITGTTPARASRTPTRTCTTRRRHGPTTI